MNAVETRYLGPTNYRGSRLIAEGPNGQKVTVDYPDEQPDGLAAHSIALAAFLREYPNWPQTGWIGGGSKAGYVFVHPDGRPFGPTFGANSR